MHRGCRCGIYRMCIRVPRRVHRFGIHRMRIAACYNCRYIGRAFWYSTGITTAIVHFDMLYLETHRAFCIIFLETRCAFWYFIYRNPGVLFFLEPAWGFISPPYSLKGPLPIYCCCCATLIDAKVLKATEIKMNVEFFQCLHV